MELIRDPKTGMYLTSEKGDCSGSYVSQKDYDEKAAVAEEYYLIEDHLLDLVKSYSYTLAAGWNTKYKNQQVGQILRSLFQQIFSPEFAREQATRYGMLLTPEEDKKEEKDVKLSATTKKFKNQKQWDLSLAQFIANNTTTTNQNTQGQFIIADDLTAPPPQGGTFTGSVQVPQDNPETVFATNQIDF